FSVLPAASRLAFVMLRPAALSQTKSLGSRSESSMSSSPSNASLSGTTVSVARYRTGSMVRDKRRPGSGGGGGAGALATAAGGGGAAAGGGAAGGAPEHDVAMKSTRRLRRLLFILVPAEGASSPGRGLAPSPPPSKARRGPHTPNHSSGPSRPAA